MKFQRGDLVEVMGKMDGQTWTLGRGIVTGFFFGPTKNLIEVTVLQSEIASMAGAEVMVLQSEIVKMAGAGRLFSETSLQPVEEG